MSVVKNSIVKILFESGMFVGSFIVALFASMFPILSISLRHALGRVLLDMVDKVMKNKVVLELAINVRWKNNE